MRADAIYYCSSLRPPTLLAVKQSFLPQLQKGLRDFTLQSKVNPLFLQQFDKAKPEKMESRFNFRDMQFISYNTFENCENQSVNPKERNIPITLADEDDLKLELPFYQKSTQNLTQAYEISFQNNFMVQHQTVFKRQVQNYMESVRTYLQQNGQKIAERFPEGLYNLRTNMSWEDLIMMTGIALTQQQKNKFFEDLKYYDKLSEFLSIVADYCPAEIAIELVQISHQILEEFLGSEHKDNVFVDSSVLLELAANKAKNLENVNLLNLRVISSQVSENSELMAQYQKFIEIYCSTTILIIAQEFGNPFNLENEPKGLKRSLNSFSEEDEDSIEEKIQTPPQKKRKFSF